MKKRQSDYAFALVAALLASATLLAACSKQTKKAASSSSAVSSSMSAVWSGAASGNSSSVSAAVSSAQSSASERSSTSSSASPAASSSAAQSAVAGFTLYSNARYGYSVPVLTSLKAVNSGSTSGQTFASDDHTVICNVSGSNNAQNLKPSDYFNQYFYSMQAGILSKQESGNTTLVTWQVDGKYGYIKSVVGTGSINTVRFQFPEGQKGEYESAAQYMLSHFETPGVGSSH